MFYLLDNSSKTAPAASWLTLVRIFIEITCDKGYFLKNSKTALTNYLAKVASLCDLPHSFRASLGIEIVEHHMFWHPWSQRTKYPIDLTLSWRWSLSYRNQSIDLLWKSMDWFYMIETSVRKDWKVGLMPYYLLYHVIYLLLKQLIVTKTGASLGRFCFELQCQRFMDSTENFLTVGLPHVCESETDLQLQFLYYFIFHNFFQTIQAKCPEFSDVLSWNLTTLVGVLSPIKLPWN